MKRLAESGTELERGLLDSLRFERPSPELEQRMRDAIGLGPVPAPSPTAPTAPATGASFGGYGAIALGTVAAALFIGGGAYLGAAARTEAPAPSPIPELRSNERPATPAGESTSELPRPAVPAPEQPLPAPRAAPPRERVVSSEPAPSLRDEIALIDEVRVAVRDGDAVRARALLDRYARRYPNGTFTAEARILRQRALERDEAGRSLPKE